MRLTLRTLLAYQDDRLSAANAKELGQKIANSPFASELVERIREVKRRRRLAIPDKPVAIIDANLIAEYLDDQLTPELVAQLEKEFLASDAMLAEVASAHEILGLLSDPVAVEPRLRDRLYAFDPSGKTNITRDATGDNLEDPKSRRDDGSEWKPLLSTEKSSRQIQVFIVAGLIILWLGVVVSDSVLFGPKVAQVDVAIVAVEADQESPLADKLERGPIPATAPDNADAIRPDDATLETGMHDVTESASATPGDANPSQQPTVNAPAVATAPIAAAVEVGLQNPVLSGDGPDALTGIVDPVGGEPEDVVNPSKVSSPFHVMASNKTFFVFDETIDRWMKLGQIPGGEIVSTSRNTADCELLFQQRWFAVAEPFSANLTAEERGWNAMLMGTVLARLSPGSVQGLEVFSGRIKLFVDRAQPWVDDNLPVFSLKTARVTSRFVLHSKDTVVGLEVLPVANMLQADKQVDVTASAAELLHLTGADFRVKVTVVTGEATVQLSGIEQGIVLTKGTSLSWLAPSPSDSTVGSSTPEDIISDDGNQIAAVPTWLHGDTTPVPEATVLDAQITDVLAKGDDPAQAMIALLSDRNPQLGVRAAYVLRATCDIERLLSALFEPLDESVHRAAIDGLSQIANGSSEGRNTIRNALETRLPMSEVELTVSLLVGFGDPEARDADYCQSVVDLLNNDRLATRTLAFYRIQQYSNDRLGYQPEAESSRRRDAMRRWQKFLERNGGKLLP